MSSLERAILNLIANAIWHNDPKVTIEVQTMTIQQHSYCIIADNGHGIPKDKQELIFQRFYRGETARKSGHRGTGLGLAIVEMVVASHGGTLELDSAEGVGTRFKIALDSA